jgi:hypothetical protein
MSSALNQADALSHGNIDATQAETFIAEKIWRQITRNILANVITERRWRLNSATKPVKERTPATLNRNNALVRTNHHAAESIDMRAGRNQNNGNTTQRSRRNHRRERNGKPSRKKRPTELTRRTSPNVNDAEIKCTVISEHAE